MSNYLYNGVELPALPEWDKEAYPYALIYMSSYSTTDHNIYVLKLLTEKFTTSNGLVASGDYVCHIGEGYDFAWNKQSYTLQGIVKWTNHDIINPNDNSLYLAASDPVPVPMKYLYNGTELPALPEWDKATYPYAMMRYSSPTQTVVLHLSTTPLTIDQIGSGIVANYWLLGNGAGYSIAYNYSPIDGETDFKRLESEDDDYDDGGIVTSAYNSYKPRWANYDLYEIDGTLFLDASYPTDAETGEEIHDYEIVVPVLPEASPVSPYICQNGAWVKHDVYKQVGNAWVKQPQAGFEVKDGAWQAIVKAEQTEPEPIAYLYNGVRLPPFPERDESTYPYIVLGHYSSRDTSIVFFMKNSGSGSRLSSGDLTVNITSGNNVAYEYDSENNTWVSFTPNYFLGNSTTGNVFWSNYDVYVGTELALAASEPVPVYE